MKNAIISVFFCWEEIAIRTPISWVGNKTSILPVIYGKFPLHYERYIEPFGGSGAVLLGKQKPDKFEVYNDYNKNLVNLFRCIKITLDKKSSSTEQRNLFAFKLSFEEIKDLYKFVAI